MTEISRSFKLKLRNKLARLKKEPRLKKRRFRLNQNSRQLRLELKIKFYKPNFWLKVWLRQRQLTLMLRMKAGEYWQSKRTLLLRRMQSPSRLKARLKENFPRSLD